LNAQAHRCVLAAFPKKMTNGLGRGRGWRGGWGWGWVLGMGTLGKVKKVRPKRLELILVLLA